MAILRDALAAGAPPTKEISFQEEGGPVKTITVGAAPLLDADGRLSGAIAVITDITDVKLLEAEVRRVERLATVGTLAAGVAHEIKNPLVSLKTFAQLLPQKYDDPEFRTSFSQIASAEIERINSLVEQLLRFARPPKPIAVPIDVHEPLEGTLSLLATELTKKNISVKTHYHEGPLIVHGDSEQLRQVFMNVLLNAVEALSPKGGGEIEITTGKRRRWSWIAPPSNSPLPQGYSWSDEEATIRIEDNGPGIKEAHLKYVFDPFFTTKDTGHGLGLSIAHNIVREHHGSINADNRPGGGAAFTVTLPLLETQEEKQRGETHELRAGSVP
jgi:two-component system nitrogen regulation sensor histidine kinase GlnL